MMRVQWFNKKIKNNLKHSIKTSIERVTVANAFNRIEMK